MKLIKLTDAHSEAMEVLANITQARYIVQNGPFTAEMYESINGSDRALENLLGKSIVFDTLENSEKLHLRKEILDSLLDQEFKMLSALRKTVASVASDLESVMQDARSVQDKQDLLTLRFTHRVDPKNFSVHAATDVVDTNCFPAPAVETVTEALDAASEFLDKVAPIMTRIYDEEQQTQENPPDPDENNGQGIGHQVYQPFHTEETEDAITEVINACANNVSLSQSASKLARSGHTLSDIGYHEKEDAAKAVQAFTASKQNFLKSVRNIYNILPNETNSLESFGRNSASFYKAVESIIGLINRADMVREGMDESIETLTALGK